jgi:hypothetical protein
MEDEHDLTVQKKLSFSIDTILDKPQALYLKLKSHHALLGSDDEQRKQHSDHLSFAERLTSTTTTAATATMNNKDLHFINTNSDEHDGNSDCSASSCSDVDDADSCSEENDLNGIQSYDRHELPHRKKKTRTVFSRTQIFQLETTFDRKRYLSSADRANLAQGLRLTEQQVKVRVKYSDV